MLLQSILFRSYFSNLWTFKLYQNHLKKFRVSLLWRRRVGLGGRVVVYMVRCEVWGEVITIISLIAAVERSPPPLHSQGRYAPYWAERSLSLRLAARYWVHYRLHSNTVYHRGHQHCTNTAHQHHISGWGYQGETPAQRGSVSSEKIIISLKYFLMRNILTLPPSLPPISVCFSNIKSRAGTGGC